MSVSDERTFRRSTSAPSGRRRPSPPRESPLVGGGPDGNEVLTTLTGMLLIVLLAAIGLTIVFIGRLLPEHLFIGFMLLGPVLLKLASTGYRFTRYYTGKPAYVEKGAPWLILRLTAPIVVLSTLAVFITGIVLIVVGPLHRDPWTLLHKASFIVWIAFTALHVAGHIPELSRMLGLRSEILQLPGIRTDLDAQPHRTPTRARGGAAGRTLLLGGSVVVGLVIALLLIPDYHTWTTLQPLLHDHGGH